jgi:branched-subunit amino acid ABC-type transport system permease component
MGWVLIILGFVIAMTATALLVLGKIGSGLGIIIGALGIGLIAISGRWLPKEGTEKYPRSKGN